MSRRNPQKQWYVVEQKKGGKNWRRCRGSTGTKDEATNYRAGMVKHFGDQFNYRLRPEWV